MDLTRENGRLVEVVIKATGDDALGYDAIREATNTLLNSIRRERVLGGPARLAALRHAYEAAGGKLTPEYLAQLAVAYEKVATTGRAVIPALAAAIGGNPATVKGHVLKAREENYLTPTTPGKEGGEATDKARELIAAT